MKAESTLGTPTSRIGSILSAFRFHHSSFPVVPLAVPYWNGATYRNIANCFVTGNLVDGSELGNLKSSVIEALGVADVFLCGSGTLALEVALRACGVGRGDEVVVPTFCCSAVVAPILATRAVPVLADVAPELNITAADVEPVLSKRTKAIIVPHLFGNPTEIGSIIDLVKGRNIHVVDDAAQALGANIDGRPVGSFGDAGILSFGKGKVCFGLGGGAVVVKNNDLAARIAGAGLPAPSGATALRNYLSTLVWCRWRRWSLPLEGAFSRSPRAGPDTPPTRYRQEMMANLDAAVALSLMQTLRENITARRARVGAYQELLGGDERLQLIAHRSGSACLTQVVRVLPRRGEDVATRVVAALWRAGYEVQGSYVPIHLLRGYEQCVWDRLSNAEKIWPDLIELPCEPTVGLDRVQRIAEIIKNALGDLTIT